MPRKVQMRVKTELKIRGIAGFFAKKVTPFGTGAKVDCPKEYLGRKAYIVILKDKE